MALARQPLSPARGEAWLSSAFGCCSICRGARTASHAAHAALGALRAPGVHRSWIADCSGKFANPQQCLERSGEWSCLTIQPGARRQHLAELKRRSAVEQAARIERVVQLLQPETDPRLDAGELSWGERIGTGLSRVHGAIFRQRDVAVKLGGASEVDEMLRREARFLSELRHHRIVELLGVSWWKGSLCLVLELASGSLGQLLHGAKGEAVILPAHRFSMALHILEGLGHLHGKRVVHCDLKSQNVLLFQGPEKPTEAKLSDFGLAARLPCSRARGGTAAYLSPERLASECQLHPAADVWAIGCVLIELFGGGPPHGECESVENVKQKVLRGEGPAVPEHLDLAAGEGEGSASQGSVAELLRRALTRVPVPITGRTRLQFRRTIRRIFIAMAVECSCEIPGLREVETFEEVLRDQLDSLHQILLHQHLTELQEHGSKTLADFVTGSKSLAELVEVVAPSRVDTEAIMGQELEIEHPWARFAVKLLETTGDEIEQVPSREQEDILKMKPVWKIPLSQVPGTARMYEVSLMSPDHTLRINNALTDDSWLQQYVVGPRSRWQLFWSSIATILILWDLITIPLEMYSVPELNEVLDGVGIFSFCFWTLDIPLHFIFGIQLGGTLELRPKRLALIYLQSWFCLDVLVVLIDCVVFLLEAVVLAKGEGAVIRSARFLRTLRLLRLVRLLRVVKLYRELSLLANRFLSTHAFMVMKIVAGLMMMLAMNHLIACAWYGITALSGENGVTWVMLMDMEEASFGEVYVASVHWALTQFTPATNNIAPGNGLERFFSIWIILLAMGVFSSFIGSISATVSSLRSARLDNMQKQSKMLQFFIERNLSVDLYGKVQEALRKEGAFRVRLKETEVSLIAGIPERFKIQLHEEMFAPMLEGLGIWPVWEEDEGRLLFRLLSHRAMAEQGCTPGQDAFIPGQACQQVLMLQEGCMNYAAKDYSCECSALSAANLCLPVLWAEWFYRGRLTAVDSLCYFVTLSSEEFGKIILEVGGGIFKHLQILGFLLVGHIEHMVEDGKQLKLDQKFLGGSMSARMAKSIKARSTLEHEAQAQEEASPFAKTHCQSDSLKL
ncbi:unnamed protein product [Effrenium voratum]|nr:unnamed protein product [Effrenium voratum]